MTILHKSVIIDSSNVNGEKMIGIDLNGLITYKHASFRIFKEKEHHSTRFCKDNVLLLVFEGVLRFSEDYEEFEVRAGEYYIQKKNTYQDGMIVSDQPKYLYVHFDAEWADNNDVLPKRGFFDFSLLSGLMERIDETAHRDPLYSEMQYLVLKLLLILKTPPAINTTAQLISEYLENNIATVSSLSDICREFHYSKNYIIRIFKKEFGVSPIQYVNDAKIKRAMYLLETTSRPVKEITEECGYSDYPYFYKRFVRKTGLSPLRWRRQIQENPLSDR